MTYLFVTKDILCKVCVCVCVFVCGTAHSVEWVGEVKPGIGNMQGQICEIYTFSYFNRITEDWWRQLHKCEVKWKIGINKKKIPVDKTLLAARLYRKLINPLNAELNLIRHLLALVGARHIVHVSRIRVKSRPPFASIGRSSPYCPR